MLSSIKPRLLHIAVALVAVLVSLSFVVERSNNTNDETCQTESNGTCLLVEPDVLNVKNIPTENIDFGVPQNIVGHRAHEIQEWVDKSMEYMKNVVHVEPKYADVKDHCKWQHEDCSFWALVGECEKNPNYMHVNCAPSCQTCDKILFESRCPLDKSTIEQTNIWGPGDLNRMFERIVTAPEYKRYNPKVLSRPKPDVTCTSPKATPTKNQPGDVIVGRMEEEDPPQDDYQIGPWAVLLEDFATPQECDRLIQLGELEGYERSSDVGERKFDGTYDTNINNGRTSTNSWCQHECYRDPLAQSVIGKITNLTEIPELNSEYLQLLRYEEGQYYQTHSDYIPYQQERHSGVRLLTVYVYLNDVEEGGGTEFPQLGLVVKPKRGMAAIWPSVLDEDPNKKDSRTIHQALPVRKGVKYGANAWVHMRDFKTHNNAGCT